MLMMTHILSSLGTVILPLNATWSQNATTIAGRANGTSGSSISDLNNPEGITISTDDILYIADTNNNRLVIVNLTSSTVIGTIGSGPGSNISQLDGVTDVFVSQTSLYVLDTGNSRIQQWSRNGTNPSTVLINGVFRYSYNIFIDQYGNIYVSLFGYNAVIRFAQNSSDFEIIAGNGTAGSEANQLNNPAGICVDDNLTLYVADYGNNRIQMWKYGASSGLTAAGNGMTGSSLKRVSYPTAIIVDINGYMYITDARNDRIVRWAPNSTIGVCIAACSGTGGNADQLNTPQSLAFDSYGSLYVTDQNNQRVQKFQILNNQSNIIILKRGFARI